MRDKQYKILDEWMNVERLRLIYLYDCADADRDTHAEREREIERRRNWSEIG